jgi:ribosome-binding factor A
MRRIEQVNHLLKEKLANLISREIPMENGLATVIYVDCSPDLKNAKIAVSVLPFNSAKNIIEKLKKYNSLFSGILKKETRLHHIPKFRWVIDDTEEEAGKIEKFLAEIKLEDNK